jgi:transcriptional regulator with XRE-family HTH domain
MKFIKSAGEVSLDKPSRFKTISRARRGVEAPPSLIEALREGGVTTFDGSPNLIALEIGERIRGARQSGGLTQAELARRAGCNQGDLSNIERGKGRDGPSYKTLKAIAEALGVELAINPRPTPQPAIFAIGNDVRISYSTTAYKDVYPLYAEFEWSRIRERIANHLTVRDAPAPPIMDVACQIFNVAPAQRAVFRCDPGLYLVGKIRGAGGVRVKKAVYRFHASEPDGAVAILGEDSEMVIDTAEHESCVFMAVPAGVLMAREMADVD